ncbi:MAG: hypothetical protein DRO46_04410, partial [Candidatus Hecatellales archaeon]
MFEPRCRVEILAEPHKPIPLAVASSPGLRSVGWEALLKLKGKLSLKPLAEIYCEDFPVAYETQPSYAAAPKAYGRGGVLVEAGEPTPPKVKVSFTLQPLNLLLVEGYHANFYGQYEVAETVADLLSSRGVKRLYVLAGYAMEGGEVCCAASSRSLLEEAEKKFGLKPGYVGPFLGFSGL